MPCPQGGGLGSCAAVMNVRYLSPTVPSVALSVLDGGHTYVSCPHQFRQYPHNTLWPRSDCPNTVSSSASRTAEITSSMSGPSTVPSDPIATTSAGSAPPSGHDRLGHSVQPLHSQHNYRWPGSISLPFLLSALAGSDSDISEPRLYGTDNARLNVITSEIGCSLRSPFLAKLRQQLAERIAVSGLISHTHPGPA